ncbi:MAG TPA: Gfo/Idh/MocA family oxidoreductase [Clostridia bacterium]|nr:Gfo/Idh/MocA family oxidoreductase [Clostridia bacterium]
MDTKILLVGVGGYGALYVNAALQQPRRSISVVGVVDPYAASSRYYDVIVEKGIPIHETLEDFYAKETADLAVISTPLQFHAPQAIYCMEHGSHVLLEKPIAPNLELARKMMAARDATGKMLAIGYQWCYDEAMLRLKADVDAGLLGKPKRLRALVFPPRDLNYYNRGLRWAGKKYDAQGNPIFDSVAANATAHSLENMLWLIGKGYQGAEIETLEAETARVNDIEMFDTAVIRVRAQGGALLHFVVSHATGRAHPQNPMIDYEFENAVLHYVEGEENLLCARFHDGTEKVYGISNPGGSDLPKLWRAVDVVQGKADLPCPAETAAAHTKAMDLCMKVCPQPHVFTGEDRVMDENMLWVPGLAERLRACYETWQLPSELGGWTKR